MLLVIIFLWPLSLGFVFIVGRLYQSRQQPRNLKIIHTVPDNIDAVKIVHLDEYEGPVEEIIYKKNNRWLSGYQKVIINENPIN